ADTRRLLRGGDLSRRAGFQLYRKDHLVPACQRRCAEYHFQGFRRSCDLPPLVLAARRGRAGTALLAESLLHPRVGLGNANPHSPLANFTMWQSIPEQVVNGAGREKPAGG